MGVTSIWIRPLDSVDARRLEGTEGSAGDLVWSPDGEWIAFYANGKLKRVRQSDGLPETIATIGGFQDAAWRSKGDIIFRDYQQVNRRISRYSGKLPLPVQHRPCGSPMRSAQRV
jgi:Tol biopolymer transport system component